MKTKIVPEPFDASSFRVSIKEAPGTEARLKTPKQRHSGRRPRVCCASVANPLTQALYGRTGQNNAHGALKKDCEAGGSSEPTGALESSLVRQRLAPRLQSPAFAPPADEFTSVCGWFEFRLALYEENSVGGG